MLAQGDPLTLTSICAAWADAWNQHDVDALARLGCPDVEFVNGAGVWLRGFDGCTQHPAAITRVQMKESDRGAGRGVNRGGSGGRFCFQRVGGGFGTA